MRRRVGRCAVGLGTALAVLASSVGVAGAFWFRGFDAVDSVANDEAICEDAWTISAGFEASEGVELGDVVRTVIQLYATAEDAAFNADPEDPEGFEEGFGRNPIVEIPIDQLFIGGRSWEGETTITPPLGYPNGTVIYARAGDLSGLPSTAVPLTVGDEKYGCAPEPADLEVTLHSPHNWVFIRSWLPHIVTFPSAGVDLSTITIGTDDVAAQPALGVWDWHGTGIALFSPRKLGTTCAATMLTVTGQALDGSPLAGSIGITPVGRCHRR